MKDYEKMLETVKAIQETFDSKEFTRNDYEERILYENGRKVYSSAVIFKNKRYTGNELDRDNYIVKVARTEDYIVKKKNGDKFVGTRYFYEVNDNFMNDLKKDLKNDIINLKMSIRFAEAEIATKQRNLVEKEKMLKVFEEIVK